MHPLRQLFSSHSGESRLTRTFVIGIAALYAILIIVFAAAYHLSLKRIDAWIAESLTGTELELQRERVAVTMERLEATKPATTAAMASILKEQLTGGRELAALLIFSRTPDDHYFRLTESIILDMGLTLPLKAGDIVKEEKENNYMRKGLMDLTVEEQPYARDGIAWRNIYAPFRLSPQKTIVLQFLMRTDTGTQALATLRENLAQMRLIMVALPIALIIAVIVITALFLNRLSLLITGLTSFMKKAADGDLAVALPVTDDAHLGELALSFNSLIDELKEKTDRLGQEESNLLKDLFTRGVTALKENRLDEAIALFTSLTLVNPGTFGNYFNLGVAYAKKRDFDRSLAMFRKAQEANPSFDVTRQYLEKIEKLAAANARS